MSNHALFETTFCETAESGCEVLLPVHSSIFERMKLMV